MKIHPSVSLIILGLIQPVAVSQSLTGGVHSSSTASDVAFAAEYGKLPLSFEANRGQSDAQVKFLSRGNGYSLLLTDSAAVLTLSKAEPSSQKKLGRLAAAGENQAVHASKPVKTDVVRMELAGASRRVRVTGVEQLPGTANYFIGNDPSRWHTSVPTYAKVKYSQVYPGVDLVYYGNQRHLEYDFVVAPRADSKPLRLHFVGAEKLKLEAGGDLIIMAKNGKIEFHKPLVYEIRNGRHQPVEGRFKLLPDNSVGFTVGNYDHNHTLIVDPTLAYSTYLGGTGGAQGTAIAVDESGYAYITGVALSADFPTTVGAFQGPSDFGIEKCFVTKLNSAGTGLIYSTFLGGSTFNNYPDSIAVDKRGNAYIAGYTEATDFPVTSGAFQTTNNSEGVFSSTSGFVTKLNRTGTALVYSTYLGGNGVKGFDETVGIAVNRQEEAFVTGLTGSTNFPVTAGAFQIQNPLTGTFGDTGYVTRLNASGSGLIYSTYLGGTYDDMPASIAIDHRGSAYVTGSAFSQDFPVTEGVFQPRPGGTQGNAFVTKLDPDGTTLIYSTYLGGSFTDSGFAIAVDKWRNAYVGGRAVSTDFPVTPGAFQTTNHAFGLGRPSNGFVAKLNSDATALLYSTYLGGTGFDSVEAVAVDDRGLAFVTGFAQSFDFPVTQDAFQTQKGSNGRNNSDAFITEFNQNGTALVYSSYFGGSGGDRGNAIVLDSSRNAYLTGETSSSNFPVTQGSFQATDPGGASAFVSKFAFGANAADLSITQRASPNPAIAGTSFAYGITVHNAGPSDATNVVVTDTLPAGVIYTSGLCSGVSVLTCNLGTVASGVSKTFTVQVKLPADYLSSRGETTAQITNTAGVTSNITDPNPANNTISLKTSVIAKADLELTMTGFPNSVHEGGIVTYIMNFTNAGPSDAIQGYILDYLPTGFTFMGSSTLPCGGGVGTVLCNLGPIVPAGFTLSFSVQAKVPANFLQPGVRSTGVVNTATIRSATVDPDPGTPPSSVGTLVIP